MTIYSRPTLDPTYYAAGTEIEERTSAVAWAAIWAGTVVAIAMTLILLALGAGFGLGAASPWPGVGPSPKEFSIYAGIWLIVTQWLSSLLGGYIAGRMRTRWQIHTDEVFFRDTAHGLLTWALATVIVVGIAVLSTSLATLAASPDDVPVSAEAADAARKAAATSSLFAAISMIIGAFIASVAAAIGGRLRDKHP
jgi:hypothetical protein